MRIILYTFAKDQCVKVYSIGDGLYSYWNKDNSNAYVPSLQLFEIYGNAWKFSKAALSSSYISVEMTHWLHSIIYIMNLGFQHDSWGAAVSRLPIYWPVMWLYILTGDARFRFNKTILIERQRQMAGVVGWGFCDLMGTSD